MLEHFSKKIDTLIESHSIAWDLIYHIEKQYLYHDILEILHHISSYDALTHEQQQNYTNYLLDCISCENSVEILQQCIENSLTVDVFINFLAHLDNGKHQEKVRHLYCCLMKEYFLVHK